MSYLKFKYAIRWQLLIIIFSSSILCFCVFLSVSYIYKHRVFTQRVEISPSVSIPGTAPWKGSMVVLIMAAGSLVGTSLLFAGSLNKSMRVIELAISRFSQGDYSVRVPLNQTPEINQVCLLLNSAVARLQDVEARREKLIAEISHELRTPLTVIMGYSELLQDPNFSMSEISKLHFHEQAERIDRLLDDLQVLSQVESGNISVAIEKTALYPVIRELAHGFLINCQQSGKTLTFNFPGGLPPVYCDPLRVRQILSNLISNAIRYTGESGIITITATTKRDHLWISVEDDGIGMTPEESAQVFNHFWRSPKAKEMSTGSGLGLAITKRLIEMQSGEIQLKSEAGQGSIFQFSLPLA